MLDAIHRLLEALTVKGSAFPAVYHGANSETVGVEAENLFSLFIARSLMS
jgi:hypothetical protein